MIDKQNHQIFYQIQLLELAKQHRQPEKSQRIESREFESINACTHRERERRTLRAATNNACPAAPHPIIDIDNYHHHLEKKRS